MRLLGNVGGGQTGNHILYNFRFTGFDDGCYSCERAVLYMSPNFSPGSYRNFADCLNSLQLGGDNL